MKRRILAVALFPLVMTTAAVSQTFPNENNEVFGPLKYTIATDNFAYTHCATMHLYFMVTNITDSPVNFYCPTLNLSYHRVTLRGAQIDYFPMFTLPVIRDVNLAPGESEADTLSWDTDPATEDTIYRLWGILNIGGSTLVSGSLYVEFRMGLVGVGEEPPKLEGTPSGPNPARGELTIFEVGEFALFDILGKRLSTFRGPTTVDISDCPEGIYFVKKSDSKRCRKILILN